MTRFADKRALVTGVTSGLGRAIAERLVKEGAKVAITGRRSDRLEEAASALSEHGEVRAFVADHTSHEDNLRVIGGVVEAFGGLDLLVNNAGAIGFDGALDPKPEVWSKLMSVNVEAVYDLTCLATPHLVAAANEGRGANVVMVSSVASFRPYPGLLAYCTSKAALDMMTQVLAMELAPSGVRVNAINPGVVVTELHRASGMDDAAYDAFLERGRNTHPLGRVGTPDEVAALVAFLASDEAGWITGDRVSIDGGRALTSLR
ncbi:MAG: glucose 1-dehydrogenase [Sandaracinus sp.]|nr:glucose 1-dehydrogenase [Sandaracinus sp.]MCB9620139.1 glucose 1-dehydrogenase [Sandaracinus sp.]